MCVVYSSLDYYIKDGERLCHRAAVLGATL